MKSITSSQRKYLRSEAHHLKPNVLIGKNGLCDSLVKAIDKSLDDHELIKIKYIDHKDEKNQITDAISEKTGAFVVGKIGNTAIIFRENRKPEERKYKLPSKK